MPETVIMPYCEVDGIRTFKDSEVMEMYSKIERDGLKDIVFSSGDINSPEEFLKEMNRPGAALLYVVYHGDLQIGIIWLTHFEGRSCRVHFTTFSEAWKMDVAAMGRSSSQQIINMRSSSGEYVFDVLLGLVPSFNVRAIRALEKAGLQHVGEIPHGMWNAKERKTVPATLMCLTREV